MSRPFTLVIHKFGGAALADGAAIARAAALVAEAVGSSAPRDPSSGSPHRAVVTASAMATVTNALFDLAVRAAADDVDVSIARLDALRRQHDAAWAEVGGGAACPPAMTALFAEAEARLRAAADARALTPRTLDALVALGEQVAAHLVVGALSAQGIAAQFVDPIAFLYTDGRPGGAVPDFSATREAARETLLPFVHEAVVPVVPGYIGRAPDGSIATLGRGGTDLTATTLAAALDADEVILWKDVPGFLTADPRVVPDARVITQLHFREASELSYYGAKILHPRALIPLRGRACVIRLRPFADPSAPGTTISTTLDATRQPVRALSAMTGQALVTVSGVGMLGVPGVAARTFTALQRAGISVSLITQASSEHSICLGLPAEHAAAARAQLMDAFANELARGEIDGIDVRELTATIAIVGLGMAGHPGVAARLCAALGKHDVNIIAIAQGSSEINISLVIDGHDAIRAQRAIHDEFQLGKIGGGKAAQRATDHRADVILLGFGLIGQALGNMMIERDVIARTARVVGIVDRGGYVFDPRGLTPDRIRALADAKQRGTSVATYRDDAFTGVAGTALDAVQHMLAHALVRPIVVDVTADETSPVLEYALQHGADLVLANKRPVGGNRARAESLRAIASSHGRRVLHEATVGAGLPILDTFAKLVEAGDSVRRIEGCPSGTMGYLFGEMGRSTPFSAALRGAMQLGYTEPDPRDDLSGADVARKGLILARLLGFSGEFEDVRVESLVPSDAATVPLSDFLDGLERYDADWAARVEQARARGAVLRYRATATPDSVTVGLVEVPAGSALGALNGTDNQFSFTTARYDTNPLVITGPGAGPAVTAAGVLNDVLKLAGAG
jgi:aspartokinase/homoserine dehydrogenase 1